MMTLDHSAVLSLLPKRPADSHKGTFGTLLCLTGCRQYRGAAMLCAEGALRSGVGIVQVASVETVLSSLITRLPECTLLPCEDDCQGLISPCDNNRNRLQLALDGAAAFAAGPGLGQSDEMAGLLRQLISYAHCPVVLDADGLNNLAGNPLPHPAEGALVITPHPGEMARLCGLSTKQITGDRAGIAAEFARKNNCVVVLKGHGTLVVSPDGKQFLNTTGNSGLAKGGSGDVLTGILGALLAQGMPAFEAAACAVWLHGAAADRCAEQLGQMGMQPSDLFPYLCRLTAPAAQPV